MVAPLYNCGYSYKRVGQGRDQDRSAPSATATTPSKSGDGQTTVTVTVPQDSIKRKVQSNEGTPVPNVHMEHGGVRVTE